MSDSDGGLADNGNGDLDNGNGDFDENGQPQMEGAGESASEGEGEQGEEGSEGDEYEEDDEYPPIPDSEKTPVTVVTGFLGAGKTTLVNWILKEQRELKICVIENEFGAVSIDDALVSENIRDAEDIVVMDNGCVCCTVRGDLVRTLLSFEEKRKTFDCVLLETTGLADPSPIVTTFNANQDVKDLYRIDSIICLVDCKNICTQLDRQPGGDAVNEAAQQLAFADRIVMNKIDLVSPEEKQRAKERITSVNAFAEVIESQNSKVPIQQILSLSSYNLERTLQLLEAETAADAEKALAAANQKASNANGDGHSHGHSHGAEESSCSDPHCGDHAHTHTHEDGDEPATKKHKSEENGHAHTHDAHTHAPKAEERVVNTRHDSKVGSIGLTLPGSFDTERFNAFMADLIDSKAPDIYRLKGLLSFNGQPQKWVFQGIHEQIECDASTHSWQEDGSDRVSKVVFIGYDLDQDAIRTGLHAALATEEELANPPEYNPHGISEDDDENEDEDNEDENIEEE